MNVLLPVAGVEISWLGLAGLGLVVGFLAGLLGVGGGFLLTPLLMSLGVPPVSAVGSDIAHFAGMASSGTYHHWRAGNVDVKFGTLLMAGGIPGFFGGAVCKGALCARGSFGLWVRVFYIVLLSIIGLYMLFETSRPETGERSRLSRLLGRLPGAVEFRVARVRMNPAVPVAVGALVGVFATMLGIGGGVIVVPLLIYVLGLPTRAAVGTSLFQIFGVSLVGTVIESKVNSVHRPVDALLAFLLLVGSTVGVRAGSWVSVRTGAKKLRRIFALLVLGVLAKVAYELIAGETAARAAAATGSSIAEFALERPMTYGLVVALGSGAFGLFMGLLLGRAGKE